MAVDAGARTNVPYRLIVVCGLHRSGTTYIGMLLSKSPRVLVVYELRKVMARVISDYSPRFSLLMILRHEDFCASPLFSDPGSHQ